MGGLSSYYSKAIINHLAGLSTMSAVTPYLALFTASTGLDSDSPSFEVSGGAYARVALTLTAAADEEEDEVPTGYQFTQNDGDVSFTRATASWGTVTHAAIMDAATAGHVVAWTELTNPREILTGDVAEFVDGELIFKMT